MAILIALLGSAIHAAAHFSSSDSGSILCETKREEKFKASSSDTLATFYKVTFSEEAALAIYNS
jgi:hypothetical protein